MAATEPFTAFKNLTESVDHILTAIAILVGGAWTLWKFGLFREKYPGMEITVGFAYLGSNNGQEILELFAIVENKGKARKWIGDFTFAFLYLSDGADIKEDKAYLNNMVEFRNILLEKFQVDKKYWVDPTWHIPFVDGGCRKRFTYITAVPPTARQLSLFTNFIDYYSKEKALKKIMAIEREGGIKPADNSHPLDALTRIDLIVRNGALKSDYYYTQACASMEELKRAATTVTTNMAS